MFLGLLQSYTVSNQGTSSSLLLFIPIQMARMVSSNSANEQAEIVKPHWLQSKRSRDAHSWSKD